MRVVAVVLVRAGLTLQVRAERKVYDTLGKIWTQTQLQILILHVLTAFCP